MLPSIIRMIQAYRERRRNYRRTFAELSSLSDRDLADLGLSRADIPNVAAGKYNGWR